MINKIILASKSGVRKKILNENGISCEVVPSNIDEDQIKESLLKEKASPEIISKNLAELKANKVSKKNTLIFKRTGDISSSLLRKKILKIINIFDERNKNIIKKDNFVLSLSQTSAKRPK